MKNLINTTIITSILALGSIATVASAEVSENGFEFKVVAKNVQKVNVDKPHTNLLTMETTYNYDNFSVTAGVKYAQVEGSTSFTGSSLGLGYDFNEFVTATHTYNFTADNNVDQAVTMLFWNTRGDSEENGFNMGGYVQHINKISRDDVDNRLMTKFGGDYRYNNLTVGAKIGYQNQGDESRYYGNSIQASYKVNDNVRLIAGKNAYKNSKSNNIFTAVVFNF